MRISSITACCTLSDTPLIGRVQSTLVSSIQLTILRRAYNFVDQVLIPFYKLELLWPVSKPWEDTLFYRHTFISINGFETKYTASFSVSKGNPVSTRRRISLSTYPAVTACNINLPLLVLFLR